MSNIRVPKAIRFLTQYGAQALKGTTINGRYFGPMVPTRVATYIRKRAIVEGTYGKFIPHIGGWDPAWDEQRKFHLIKPMKGHLRDRTRAKRAAKIDQAMKEMPAKIEKYYEEMHARKPKKDLISRLRKMKFFEAQEVGPPGGRSRKEDEDGGGEGEEGTPLDEDDDDRNDYDVEQDDGDDNDDDDDDDKGK